MPDFEIRPANLADYEAIVNIRTKTALDVGRLTSDTAYKVAIQKSGFLLPYPLSEAAYEDDLDAHSVYEEASGQDKKVIGYYSLHDKASMGERGAHWFGPDKVAEEHQAAYFAEPHAYLHTVGVLPYINQRGIGSKMLNHLEDKVRDRDIPWLFSMIVVSPVTNIASLLLHEKTGFERLALLEPTEVLGMHGFQNLLYGKQLR